MMRILIFTEGTALMFKDAKDMSIADRVKQSKIAGMQREERSRSYEPDSIIVDYGSVHDYANYIPNGNVVSKLGKWKSQGAKILYLTSRRTRKEIENVRSVLKKYNFPDYNRFAKHKVYQTGDEGEVRVKALHLKTLKRFKLKKQKTVDSQSAEAYSNRYFRNKGEDYNDVVEMLMPDVLIEDDCESIGGGVEMVYPHINPQLRGKIKSIVVKEFEGMDHLPDDLNTLKSYNMDSVSSTE